MAEQANVRLAVHPNDPPPPRYRGTDQILGSVDGLKRVCETVKSPANGITLDVGVTREMGSDVIDTIKWFGGRDQINHVHFRNVLMKVPRERLRRDLHRRRRQRHAGLPAGAARDRLSAPAASRITCRRWPATPGRRGGWGYAVGQIKAMLRQL